MNKSIIRILTLVLLAAFLLTACASKAIEVDLVYTYTQQTKNSIRSITITYPNGGH